jgi:hypothetical protein
MDKDRNSRKDRESLIEDKLKKILFGSKSSTVRDDKSSHSKELDSIPDNYFSKEYVFNTDVGMINKILKKIRL